MNEAASTIASIYLETDSLEETARRVGVSTGKIRKILLTEGLWAKERIRQIEELSKNGLSVEEMSNRLCVSTKTVSAYMPYTKGEYMKVVRSTSALCSERWRENKEMEKICDRVLFSRGNYEFVAPSSRDVLIYSGFFQFNLSALIALTKNKEKTTIDIKRFTPWLKKDEAEFDEPPIVLEFNPLSIHSNESMDLESLYASSGLVLLNNEYQMRKALERGEDTYEVYVFRMEEYLSYYKPFSKLCPLLE